MVPSALLYDALARYTHQCIAVLSFDPQPAPSPPLDTLPNIARWITATPIETDYARHLYAWLHELDHTSADVIWIEWRAQSSWPGVADRLHRASSGMLSMDVHASA